MSQTIEIDTVNVSGIVDNKNVELKSYFRSWKIVNDSLTDYCDGEVFYNYPLKSFKEEFKKAKVNGRLIHYRNLYKKETSVKKRKIIEISFITDNYAKWKLPKNDLFNGEYGHLYSKKKTNDSDSVFTIFFKNEEEIGQMTLNNDGSYEIRESFLGKRKDVSIQIDKIHQWSTLFPTYIFTKQISKGSNKEEIVITEVFVKINNVSLTKTKSKSDIKFNQSFYKEKYWLEYEKEHPMPPCLKSQIDNFMERENVN